MSHINSFINIELFVQYLYNTLLYHYVMSFQNLLDSILKVF